MYAREREKEREGSQLEPLGKSMKIDRHLAAESRVLGNAATELFLVVQEISQKAPAEPLPPCPSSQSRSRSSS